MLKIPDEFIHGCLNARDIYYIKVIAFYLQKRSCGLLPSAYDIASEFGLTVCDVTKIYSYWKQFGFELEFDEAEDTLSECAAAIEETPLEMYQSYADLQFTRKLSDNDKKAVITAYEEAFPYNLFSCFVDFCVVTSLPFAKSLSYVIPHWKTYSFSYDAAVSYLKDVLAIAVLIRNNFGHSRRTLTYLEYIKIDKWLMEYKFDVETITFACENTVLTASAPSISYMDAILRSWYDHGYKNPGDVQKKPVPNVNKEKKNAFTNFTQSDMSAELDQLEKLFHMEVNKISVNNSHLRLMP